MGDQGGAGFGGLLPSAATLLVYSYQRVGRANGVNFLFALPLLNFPGPGVGVFRKISTIGGGAFRICMPACREGEQIEHCFCVSAVQFSGREGGVFG